MKILLFGSTGQIGTSLLRNLRKNFEVITTYNSNNRINLTDEDEVKKFLKANESDIYINAAAYTNVNEAENNKNLCTKINYFFPKLLTDFLKDKNKILIHYSTDYVYGNHNSVDYLNENLIAKPINHYGYTKMLAEDYIKQNYKNFYIFRVSWIYSHIRQNFFLTIKNLLKEKNKIHIVNDQWGSPTPANYISSITSYLINNNQINVKNSGTYNLSCKDHASWYDFAQLIEKSLNTNNNYTSRIYPIISDEYKTIALRQKNSKLDCSKFVKKFNFKLDNWKISFQNHLNE